MGATIIEKILASHAGKTNVRPGDIIDVSIDARVARDFGGANVVKNLVDNGLDIENPLKTFFTFDCNPTGSDQKYAANQHRCRIFARENGIKVFDIDQGIGTHILIEEGLAYSGTTAVSTDSHANILGAVGAFGQGMGDKDIAAAWHNGKIWFKTPQSAKIVFEGKRPAGVSAKDIVLNMLALFGSNSLLGYSLELYGDAIERLTLDERITLASMATELGAIIILIPPGKEIIKYYEARAKRKIEPILADENAHYDRIEKLDISKFRQLISLPGKPHDTIQIPNEKIWIDSAFIGSCTNGRLQDLQIAACILKGRKLAPGVVLKIVPSTSLVWQQALEAGIIEDLKEAGAMISNPGCAGCAAGQVGQNGPGEITISTGNRNFPGKQGQGDVYLASPEIVAASAIAGFITSPEKIPEKTQIRPKPEIRTKSIRAKEKTSPEKALTMLSGRAWVIAEDDIDTDMIFHNSHLAITSQEEMGAFAFGNLKGYENFAKEAKPGDIILTGKNFGSGSSRQQAVDCFKALGISAIIAESFGSIYERNAINAAFPILTTDKQLAKNIHEGDILTLDLEKATLRIPSRKLHFDLTPFSEVQMEIYRNNGLF